MNVSKHPILDCALAAVAALALIAEGVLRAGHGLPGYAYALAISAALPLTVLRLAPLPSLLAIEAGAIACVAVFGPSRTAIALVMVPLYAVAVRGDRQRSLIVGAVTGTALVVTVLLVDGQIEIADAALRLLLIFAALIVGDTVRSRRILRTVADERARREAREREEETRRRLAGERLRIARDLHDTLAHALVAINVRAGVAAHLRDRQDPAAALLDIKEASAAALRDLRATLHLLRQQDDTAPAPPASDLSALPDLIARVEGSGLTTRMTLDVNSAMIPSPVAQTAFRIVQEALTNVLRHAEATSAQVIVGTEAGVLTVQVTDDGTKSAQPVAGHGLRGMTERAAALGGRVTAGPRVEGGWRVQAHLPLSLKEP